MNGKCFCGSVQFTLKEQLKDAYYCHCRDCQMLSGSAFRVFGIVPTGSVEILAGVLETYTHIAESGFEMRRSHCSKCATPLFVSGISNMVQ